MCSLVLRGKGGDVRAVEHPLELQGPAALSQAGQDQAVALQVDLSGAWLSLEIRGHVTWRTQGKSQVSPIDPAAALSATSHSEIFHYLDG